MRINLLSGYFGYITGTKSDKKRNLTQQAVRVYIVFMQHQKQQPSETALDLIFVMIVELNWFNLPSVNLIKFVTKDIAHLFINP